MLRLGEVNQPMPFIDNGESLGGIPTLDESRRTVSVGSDLAIQYNTSDANSVDITYLLNADNTADMQFESIMATVAAANDANAIYGFQDPSLQKETTETTKDNTTLYAWIGGAIVLIVTAIIFIKWRKRKKRLRRK